MLCAYRGVSVHSHGSSQTSFTSDSSHIGAVATCQFARHLRAIMFEHQPPVCLGVPDQRSRCRRPRLTSDRGGRELLYKFAHALFRQGQLSGQQSQDCTCEVPCIALKTLMYLSVSISCLAPLCCTAASSVQTCLQHVRGTSKKVWRDSRRPAIHSCSCEDVVLAEKCKALHVFKIFRPRSDVNTGEGSGNLEACKTS